MIPDDYPLDELAADLEACKLVAKLYPDPPQSQVIAIIRRGLDTLIPLIEARLKAGTPESDPAA
jgi:hypothetical protein